MITIEISQRPGDKPEIYFRPESNRHTAFGRRGLLALKLAREIFSDKVTDEDVEKALEEKSAAPAPVVELPKEVKPPEKAPETPEVPKAETKPEEKPEAPVKAPEVAKAPEAPKQTPKVETKPAESAAVKTPEVAKAPETPKAPEVPKNPEAK